MHSPNNESTGTNAGDALKEMLKTVSANPAEIKFPKDQWGFTSGVRREVLRACASVRGNDEKHAILVATLAILLQHTHKRLPKDKELNKTLLERRKAATAGRAVKEVYGSSLVEPVRVNTGPVNTNEV